METTSDVLTEPCRHCGEQITPTWTGRFVHVLTDLAHCWPDRPHKATLTPRTPGEHS